MKIIWLALCIFMVILEVSTINLVSIWFALGALVTSIASIWINNLTIQIIIFTFSSTIIFLLVRPFAKKLSKGNIHATNLDRVIGKIGIVTKDIIPLDVGEVKVDGKHWSAYSDTEIKKDNKVQILAIEGVKLKVKKYKEEI